MKWLVGLLVSLALTATAAAQSNNILVVPSCGTAVLQSGTNRIGVLTVDTTGRLCSLATTSSASPVQVTPFTSTNTATKVTVSVTNTFTAALASSSTRKGCTLQYVAVAGTKGYVFFGSSTPADTTTSLQLTSGQSIQCDFGLGVLTDQILVTGTATDIFVVNSQ